MYFVWNDANIDHLAKHDVDPSEAEEIVRKARPPYPRGTGGGKMIVRGSTSRGRRLQVIFVYREADSIDPELLTMEAMLAVESGEPGIYVVHARDLQRGET